MPEHTVTRGARQSSSARKHRPFPKNNWLRSNRSQLSSRPMAGCGLPRAMISNQRRPAIGRVIATWARPEAGAINRWFFWTPPVAPTALQLIHCRRPGAMENPLPAVSSCRWEPPSRRYSWRRQSSASCWPATLGTDLSLDSRI